MDGYLSHHGVKGQRWHHRRWQNPDGSLTPEGYIHYGIKPSKKAGILEPIVNARYGVAKKEYRQLSKDSTQVVSRKPLTESEKSSLGITNYIEKGGTLKKGSSLYRTALSNDSDAKKPRYFSTSVYDAEKWSREFAPQLSDYARNDISVVKDTYVTNQDIKIASAAQLGKEWEQLWVEKNGKKAISELSFSGKLTKFQDENDQIVVGGYGYSGDKERYEPLHYIGKGKAFTKIQSDKLRDLAASNIMMDTHDEGLKEVLIDRLKKKGYGGVADINGIDVSYDPIILFDTDITAKKISSIKYTSDEMKKYGETYYRLGGNKKYTEIRDISPETRAGKKAIAKSLQASGKTVQQIAYAMGLSTGQIDGLLYGEW